MVGLCIFSFDESLLASGQYQEAGGKPSQEEFFHILVF